MHIVELMAVNYLRMLGSSRFVGVAKLGSYGMWRQLLWSSSRKRSRTPRRALLKRCRDLLQDARASQGLRRPNLRKEKAHKHKQIFPVTARVRGGVLPTGLPGVSRPVARGQKFMCCVRNPRNISIFVWAPGREDRVPGREDRWPGWPRNCLCAKCLCAFSESGP